MQKEQLAEDMIKENIQENIYTAYLQAKDVHNQISKSKTYLKNQRRQKYT